MADFHTHSRDKQPEYVDSTAPILNHGTGTPYLAIFTPGGSPIMDDLNGIPIGMEVESFNYKYTEGKGDTGKFTIVTNNPGIVDHPALAFKMPLLIQWGWLLPYSGEGDVQFRCSPARTVFIKSHDIQFTPQGTKLTIEFGDAKLFLESEPSKYVYNDTRYLEFWGELAGGKLPLRFMSYVTNGRQLRVEEKNICNRDATKRTQSK